MAEQEILWLREFKKCPNCGCEDTVSQLAYKQTIVDRGKGPEAFTSSEPPTVLPLISPMSVALTVPALAEFWDICAECGLRRCTKAQVVNVPIKMMPQQGMGKGFPGGMPPGFPMGRG